MIYRDRWTADARAHALGVLRGETRPNPFGLTEDDRADLRGFTCIDGGLRFEGVRIRGIDLGHSKFENVTFAKSELEDIEFHDAELIWRDWKSRIRNCLFSSCRMDGSGFGTNVSVFENCTFRENKHMGGNSSRPEFVDCIFEGNSWVNFNFAAARFQNCRIADTFNDVWFEGKIKRAGFYNCDLRGSVFIDCTIRHTTFENCTLGDDILILGGWPEIGAEILTRFGKLIKQSARLKKHLDVLLTNPDLKDQYPITRGELEHKLRDKQLADESYRVFKSIAEMT